MSEVNPMDLSIPEMDIAEEIQQECHEAIDFIMKNKPGRSLQDEIF